MLFVLGTLSFNHIHYEETESELRRTGAMSTRKNALRKIRNISGICRPVFPDKQNERIITLNDLINFL